MSNQQEEIKAKQEEMKTQQPEPVLTPGIPKESLSKSC